MTQLSLPLLNKNLDAYLVNGDQSKRDAVYNEIRSLVEVKTLLPRVTASTYDSVREKLSKFNICTLWNESHFDRSRELFRPSFNEKHGPGATNVMPALAAYLVLPGKNKAFFPEGMDTTLIDYFIQQGFLGEFEMVKNIDEICSKSRLLQKKVYAIDDYGTRNDDIVANRTSIMKVANSKEFVSLLTDYPPLESILLIDDVNSAHYKQHCNETDHTVFIKTGNTETSGAGVYVARSEKEFMDHIETIKERSEALNGSKTVVIQSKTDGINYSFQVLLDDDGIEVISVSEQLIKKDGKSFAGNINKKIDAPTLEKISPVAESLCSRLRKINPEACGIVMCDYIESTAGKLTAIDPGLRPSGNTAASMISLLLEKSGKHAFVKNAVFFNMGQPMPYSEIAVRLKELGEVKNIIESQKGALPWGYNQMDGKGLFIIVSPTESQYNSVKYEIDRRLGFIESQKAS
jgi:hypothetical protein